jgi:hypothetical protein
MEAAGSSETLVNVYKTMRPDIPVTVSDVGTSGLKASVTQCSHKKNGVAI